MNSKKRKIGKETKENLKKKGGKEKKTQKQFQNKTKHNIHINIQMIMIPTSTTNIQIDHFKTTFHILNTLPTYKYIHFKTTFMCSRSITPHLPHNVRTP